MASWLVAKLPGGKMTGYLRASEPGLDPALMVNMTEESRRIRDNNNNNN